MLIKQVKNVLVFKDGSCDYGQNSYAWTRKVNKLNQYNNKKTLLSEGI